MSRLRTHMYIICGLLFVSSFSLLFSLKGNFEGTTLEKILAYATGTGFWLCLIMGYVLLFRMNQFRKQQKDSPSEKHWGIFSFFSNKYAQWADILLIISLVGTVLFLVLASKYPANELYSTMTVIILSVCLFSLHMHAVLNGINFQYVLDKTKQNGERGEDTNE